MAVIIPQHEQYYPNNKLSTRLEEYVLEGRSPTQNRAFAKRVTGKEVLDMVMEIQIQEGLKNIDPRYFVGTCFHESGCINEWDTEIATANCFEGFQSVGAYQIGEEEARRFGFKLEDMLDLDKATTCMVKLAEYNRAQIRTAAKLSGEDPDYTDNNNVFWKGGTMRAYLAICHNHGIGYVRSTIYRYGMDWEAYKRRNPTDNIVSHSYGEDCITGGPDYTTTTQSSITYRTLQLFMTGSDVRELQRHLKISTDGVFGVGTETALIQFQKSHGLKPDGVCGPVTWSILLYT